MTELPTINRPMDNTALSAYMKCPREFNLSMLQGWRPKEKSQALAFGAFWHRLLETHYKTGGDAAKVLDTFTKYQHEVESGGDYRTAQRAYLEYKRYIKKYPPTQDCKATLGFPNAPMVEISTAIVSDVFGHEYAGKLDRIVAINSEQAVIEDHKTTSRFDKHYFAQFENSNQMKGYAWMGKRIVTDYKIVGVRINLAHILTNKSNFERHIVYYSDSQIQEWEQNTASWLRRIQRSIQEDDFPAHFGDNGCRHLYGRCQFFDVCSTNQIIREDILKQHFHVDHWDPLKAND